jgi:hypothetical protein
MSVSSSLARDVERTYSSTGAAPAAAEVLAQLASKGAHVWVDNEQVRYKAPRGALTADDVELLRANKTKVAEWLQNSTHKVPAARATAVTHHPLSFSQLAHWHLHHLATRTSIRQIASATRIDGPLDLEAFRRSLVAVTARHDALRTRIVELDDAPVQEVSSVAQPALSIEDLSSIDTACLSEEIRRRIHAVILYPVDVASDPLCALQLLKIAPDRYLLVVAMEHTISDARSMNILLGDIFVEYERVVTGRVTPPTRGSMQFSDYAQWQQATKTRWLDVHGSYWERHLLSASRVRFPKDENPIGEGRSTWSTVPIRIEPELTARLREWARSKQTTIAMTVLTAYVGLALRWCGVADMVMRYQWDGRTNARLDGMIGYLASALYLRVGITSTDRFSDLLRRVQEEYFLAHEHADSSLFDAQSPRPDITRNTGFNWVPLGTEPARGESATDSSIAVSPYPFEHPIPSLLDTDFEPGILLFDAGSRIEGSMFFPLDRLTATTMERFVAALYVFIDDLLLDELVGETLL